MEKDSSRIPKSVKNYLSAIGRRGGQRSRRALSREQSKEMLRVREARRAYKKFRVRCFWSFDPDLTIGREDIPWVIEMLKRHGNREAWESAMSLCR